MRRTLAGDVVQVACGAAHSLVRLKNGDVYVIGSNSAGQVGPGVVLGEDTNVLQKLELAARCIDLAAGDIHSLFCMEDGTVLACGNNRYGQLGLVPCDNDTETEAVWANDHE